MSALVRRTEPTTTTPVPVEARRWNYGRANSEPIDPRRILDLIWKKKLRILLIATLVVIPVAVRSYSAPPLYRCTALIQVNPDPVQVLPYRDVIDTRTGVYYEVYMATQDQVLRSPSLAARVAARLRSADANDGLSLEAERLSGRFGLRRIPNSQLYEIGYVAPHPEIAARVVNTFAEEYIKQHFESRQAMREKARDSLKRELEVLERGVQSSEKELAQYAQREDILSIEGRQADLAERKLAAVDKQVSDAEADLIVAKTTLEAIQKAQDLPDRLVTPVISGQINRVLQLTHELASLRSTFGENWPAVVAKRDELSLARAELDRQKAAALSGAIAQAQSDTQAAQRKVSMFYESRSLQKDLVNRLNTAGIQYNILRREVETNQRLYDGLLERLKQTSVLAGFEFGNIQVVEPGVAKNASVSSGLRRNFALAISLGLALGVSLTLLLDFWDRSVSSLVEAEQILELPGLGSVPLLKDIAATSGRLHRRMLKLALPRPSDPPAPVYDLTTTAAAKALTPALPAVTAAVEESVRNVGASILLSQTDRPLRILLITSAVAAEGKTTIAILIARTLAESGARTLLVEGDLRNAEMTRMFGASRDEGLSLFLTGHVPAPKMHSTSTENLFFVPAGPQPPNPVSLLGSDRMGSFLTAMHSKEGYRFVLIDSPPVLPVADARVLAAKADGVVLVVRARTTVSNLALRARNMLESAGANLLGVVLNGADRNDPESAYYSRYYGSRYGNQVKRADA